MTDHPLNEEPAKGSVLQPLEILKNQSALVSLANESLFTLRQKAVQWVDDLENFQAPMRDPDTTPGLNWPEINSKTKIRFHISALNLWDMSHFGS